MRYTGVCEINALVGSGVHNIGQQFCLRRALAMVPVLRVMGVFNARKAKHRNQKVRSFRRQRYPRIEQALLRHDGLQTLFEGSVLHNVISYSLLSNLLMYIISRIQTMILDNLPPMF